MLKTKNIVATPTGKNKSSVEVNIIYAPVMVLVYNRYTHFVQCIESLKNCIGADQTDLFVAIDAPSKESDRDAVSKVYEYAKAITGFKSVTIFMREQNLGPRKNSRLAREAILKSYDRIITSEDDIIFAIDFLDYLNRALELYKDRRDIHAICGYNYPVNMPDNYEKDVYVWQGFNAWGAATWRNRYEMIEREPPLPQLRLFLRDRNNQKKLDAVAGHYRPALQSIVDTGHYTGDTIICYHMIKDNRYCIFPTVSRVRNIGHDGSGEHCGVDKSLTFHTQEISDGKTPIKLDINVMPNLQIYEVLEKYFRRSKLYPLKKAVRRVVGDRGYQKLRKISGR